MPSVLTPLTGNGLPAHKPYPHPADRLSCRGIDVRSVRNKQPDLAGQAQSMKPAELRGTREQSMKFGIYYPYWEREWSGDCRKYIGKVASLGFDILEIAAQHVNAYTRAEIADIRHCAEDNGIILTAGLGPSQDRYLSSPDAAVRRAGHAFFEEVLTNLGELGITTLGGGLYSYWPVDFSKPVDRSGDRARALEGITGIADFAGDCGVTLCLEALNRFENHVINTAEEGVAFVQEVNKPNVKLMLDTFHMNIEEDSFGGAIRLAGDSLGHFHTGECNRRPPGRGRIPWSEIGDALNAIGYDGAVVMEPFVKPGGGVGRDIKVWRDLSNGADEAAMDQAVKESLAFSRYVLDRG